jgi:hypothetical protein
MQQRLASNSRFFCFIVLEARITGVYHHTWPPTEVLIDENLRPHKFRGVVAFEYEHEPTSSKESKGENNIYRSPQSRTISSAEGALWILISLCCELMSQGQPMPFLE